MTSSMLENDIDELHRSRTDVLLTSFSTLPARPTATTTTTSNPNGGGDVEMSQIHQSKGEQSHVGLDQHEADDAANDAPSQQHQSHQQQDHNAPLENATNENLDGGVPEASSQWVTPKQDLYEKYNIITRKEICICVILVLIMIAVTSIAVAVAVKNHNQKSKEKSAEQKELEARIQFDIVTNRWVSTYVLPTRPVPTTVTDQEELDIIIDTLTKNPLLTGKVSNIPNTVTELAAIPNSTATTDPYVLGAQWLTTTDTYNGREHTINRYALAVFYYSLSGERWKNNTHWLSPTEYYCDWYGVVCCNDDERASILCNSNEFGKIIEIDLFRNNLIGTIPDVISLFDPSLYSMYLSENSITGTLPGAAIATLSQFGKLNVAYNFLTGTVPLELNANNVLHTLYIQANDLSGSFPKEFHPCAGCEEDLIHFGVDCKKLVCGANVCRYEYNCFVTNNTITMKQ